MRRRWLLVAGLLLLFVVGASALATWGRAGHGFAPNPDADRSRSASSAGNGQDTLSGAINDGSILIVCRIQASGGQVVDHATCHFRLGTADVVENLTSTGAVIRAMPPVDGNITADAPGFVPQTKTVHAERDTVYVFILDPLPTPTKVPEKPAQPEQPGAQPTGGPGTGSGGGPGGPSPSGSPPGNIPDPSPGNGGSTPPPPKGWQRVWRDPMPLGSGGTEPHVAVDSTGVIYYAPTSHLYRSMDGGATWKDVNPQPPTALPDAGSDDSVSVASDDSVWYSRYWGYPDSTIGCTSTDHGDSWTCNNNAVAGVTDRMWIVGIDSKTGYLQSGEGMNHPVFVKSTDASGTYVPCGFESAATQHGNLVYDKKHNKVWQISYGASLVRVDGCFGAMAPVPITVPGSLALPWMSIYDGNFWTTGNPLLDDNGTTGIVAARSTDEGTTWTNWAIPMQDAKAGTFSYIAVNSGHGPGSHLVGDPDPAGTTPGIGDYAVIVYYGSTNTGDPATQNMGVWSLHLTEATNAQDATPTWSDKILEPGVHTGNICTGGVPPCATAQSPDPNARFSGDLIGSWVDNTGLAHLAYMQDSTGADQLMYTRQDWVYFP